MKDPILNSKLEEIMVIDSPGRYQSLYYFVDTNYLHLNGDLVEEKVTSWLADNYNKERNYNSATLNMLLTKITRVQILLKVLNKTGVGKLMGNKNLQGKFRSCHDI